jgi:hypothetical protein
MTMRHTGQYVNAQCGRCGQWLKMVHKSPVCWTCYHVVLCVAREQQELAYLAAWLHTRDEERTPTAGRLRQVALKEGIDWTKRPPRAVMFVDRLAQLMAPYRAKAIA